MLPQVKCTTTAPIEVRQCALPTDPPWHRNKKFHAPTRSCMFHPPTPSACQARRAVCAGDASSRTLTRRNMHALHTRTSPHQSAVVVTHKDAANMHQALPQTRHGRVQCNLVLSDASPSRQVQPTAKVHAPAHTHTHQMMLDPTIARPTCTPEDPCLRQCAVLSGTPAKHQLQSCHARTGVGETPTGVAQRAIKRWPIVHSAE